MHRRSSRLKRLAAVVVVAGTALLVTNGIGQAGTTVRPAAAPAALTAADQEALVTDPVPLLELRTGGGGWFWTLSEAEASSAVGSYGMTLQPTKLGYLRRQAFTGSQPVFRLRSTTAQTYLLTASASERDSLTGSGQFSYEGVVGYAFAAQQPGTAVLWRMSDGSGWRVVPDAQRATFTANGYRTDGPLGYVYPTYDRAGAIYFGTFDADGNQGLMSNVDAVYGRGGDWWGGVKDFAGYDVPRNAWHWPGADFSDLKPAIGYYDDSQPATLEKQIAQASGAGLRYFTFYWYWNPAGSGGEQLVDGLKSFLQASNRADLDFNVMPCIHPWSNGDGKGGAVSLRMPSAQITTAAKTLVDTYLGQPNYLRANDGRPIIELCDTRGIGNGTTSGPEHAAVKAFTDALRAEARSKYGQEILVTQNDQLGVPAADLGVDGSQVQGRYDASRSYATYAANERGRLGSYPGVLIRGATSGFDNRPWDAIGITDPGANATEAQLENAFSWYDDQSIGRFGTLLASLQADIDASTRPPAVDNFVLVYAWNEWHEGGHIEPNVRDGCAYLDTLHTQLRLTGGSGCVPDPSLG